MHPDLVIDLTVADGRMLGIGDFNGVIAMQRLEQPIQSFEAPSGGAQAKVWAHDAAPASLSRLGDPDLVDAALHALPASSDLLL